MIKVIQDIDTGNAIVTIDDDTVMGNYSVINLDDDNGMQLMATLVAFYESKGHDPMQLLNEAYRAQQAQRLGLRQRIARFFKGE